MSRENNVPRIRCGFTPWIQHCTYRDIRLDYSVKRSLGVDYFAGRMTGVTLLHLILGHVTRLPPIVRDCLNYNSK